MKLLLPIFCICLPFLAIAQTSPQYKIYDVKNEKTISIDELIKDLDKTDVLFFGEEHNDSVGHVLEMEIFKQMHNAYPKLALSMEMFHTDVQPVINEYLDGYISEKNFTKEARAWNNYKDYRPLIEYAKTNKINVIGANGAARYSNMVSKAGLDALNTLPKESKSFLPPLPIDTATGRYYDKFIKELGSHNMGGMKIYQTQNFWDAAMSWSIVKYLKKNKNTKILQLNGRFHSDEKLGTLAKLTNSLKKLNISNLSCFPSTDFDAPDWQKYKHLGDYIIITDPGVKKTF
ncbi:ChaN family lipoprotein [Pedobacter foliorum]|uniref:ChaN family lipoprotein n=1 Tax=Pedobacter foliorum TaxID=2739058 RepID=UPI00156553E2|nr:ChaN family lipoprotein [Pedobacter foliorum]NRF41268.1 ChaN family lipoprotein [Pedobacter foliorum]